MRFYGMKNPYGVWNSSISPKYLIWERYGKPACVVADERAFDTGVRQFLEDHAERVEYHEKREYVRKQYKDPRFMFRNDSNTNLYLYKHNLISITPDDEHYNLSFYYPLGRAPVSNEFEPFVVNKDNESKVSVVISEHGQLIARKVTFAPPVIKDLDLNYGTGFGATHVKILDKLNARKSSLLMLHGDAGSGKSTYIKYLTTVCDREFIFIPVNLASQLGSPEFISLLMAKKEAVLILEDAEQAVQPRGSGDSSAVATLLNLSDGILGSLLNITVVVTYNADRQDIDKALLRKGRLMFDYHFGPLSADDANRLAASLNKDLKTTAPMTIADVYGIEDDTNYVPPEVPQMGFHTLIGTPKAG